MTLQQLIEVLEIAKKNVKFLLDNGDSSVDFKGIEYWAGQVEKLRAEIKEKL